METIAELYEAFRQSNGVSTDTRTITAGSVFVALRGANFDANTMVGRALELGASAVVTTDKVYAGDKRALVCDDTLAALQALAAEHRRHLTIPVVGITGTNGKTTTKELVTAVLRKKYKTAATRGNLNNHIGVPLTVLSISADDEMAVVEMGASHMHEIADLVKISQPTAGLITNVGIGHIEGFGSFEGVKKTKGELYDYIKATSGTIFLDSTSQDLTEMLGEYAHTVPYATGLAEANGGDTVTAHIDGIGDVKTQLTGKYNIANILAAATVGLHYGVDAKDIADAISEYKPTNSRSQIVETRRNHLIVDAYNANPSSMAAALDNLSASARAHKAVILGAMRELGAEEDRQHEMVLRRLSGMGLDSAILIGPEFKKHESRYPDFKFFDHTDEARAEAARMSGLCILVKGSNSNKLTTLLDVL